MSPRRAGIIAFQAAAVTLLVFVVYMTFLRPDGAEDLRSIEAPGGRIQANAAPPGQERGDHETRRRKQRQADRGRGLAARAGGPGTGPVVLGEANLTDDETRLSPAPDPSSGDTPANDQYSDSVGNLLRKVGTGGTIGD